MVGYDAFISYSHTKDKPIALALQSAVQKLGKPWYRRRALRVFRDDTSLSATPNLWPTIEQALDQSRFLIVLASTEAATSTWVNKEVAHWLDHKSAETVLIAITDGELVWNDSVGDFRWCDGTPLPPVLTRRFASEPKWVDLRAYRNGVNSRDAKFIELSADFAAVIHGTPKEDLLSQEVRQQRRALTLAWTAGVLLLVLAGVSSWQWIETTASKRHAVAEATRAERNFGAAKETIDSVIFDMVYGLLNIEGMSAETARRILGRAEVAIEKLAARTENDPVVRHRQAAMFGLLAGTFGKLGNASLAIEYAQKQLDGFRLLVAKDPSNTEWQHDLVVALNYLGDYSADQGDRANALSHYREALDIARTLPTAASSGIWGPLTVAASLWGIGQVLLAQGDLAGALAAHRESLDITRALTASDPSNATWQHEVMRSLDRVGDVLNAKGDMTGALSHYREALVIGRRLGATDAANMRWQSDISIMLNKVGGVFMAQGDLADALAAHRESLDIARAVAVKDPHNTEWRRNIAVSLGRLGDVEAQLAKLAMVDRAPSATVDQIQGAYHGLNTTSRIPGEHQIALTFQQSGSDVTATFRTALGGKGKGTGTLSGNAIKTIFLQSEVANCPGSYTASFTFSGDIVSWTYTGQDCGGPAQGHGMATRTKP